MLRAAVSAFLLLVSTPVGTFRDLPPVPPGTTRLYLVRHGQALSNLDPTPDLPKEQLDHLTDLGRRQSAAAGKALTGLGVSSVLTSPASRARETAEEIATVLGGGLGPEADPRLRPLDLGRTANGAALDWDERIAEWEKGKDPVPPGGESMEQMGSRVAGLAGDLARQGKHRGVVLVAHGEVIAAFVGALRGTPPPKRYPPGIANASITVVDVASDGRSTLRLANYRPEGP